MHQLAEMNIDTAAFSHSGHDRENEDAILPMTASDGVCWSAIADGLGGRAGGGIASRLVIDAASNFIGRDPHSEMEALFAHVHDQLEQKATTDDQLSKMGTTLTALRITAERADVGHVGDSRIYHLRNRGLLCRSKDQTEIQHLIDLGVISKERAVRYPRKNVLLSSLSASKGYDLYKNQFDVSPGDRILLLTDGVYRVLKKREIRDLSLRCKSAQELVDTVQAEVFERGPEDDFSLIAVFVG